MNDPKEFDIAHFTLQCGVTPALLKLAYKTYGTLNANKDNVILMPTFYGGTHEDVEVMIGAWGAIDTNRYFVVVPNQLGGGVSSSPSNTPSPLDRAVFPQVSVYDNVVCQHKLLVEELGISSIRLAVGFSMGAQQVYQWACLFPDEVQAFAAICGSAKTSLHNFLFLESLKLALTTDAAFADGWYENPPIRGLRAFANVYLGWGYSQDFFREHEYRKMGLASVADCQRLIEGYFRQRDANDLLAMISTWQSADISNNPVFNGDLEAALRAITAKAVVMPCSTDLYFRVADSEAEVARLSDATLKTIPSIWGHVAGMGYNPSDNEFISAALSSLLD